MLALRCYNKNCPRKFFYGEPGEKYCSEKCRLEDYFERNKDKLVERTCANPACGRVFTTILPYKKYCCVQCKQAHEHARYMRTRKTMRKRCAWAECATLFEGTGRDKYCSDACRELAKQARKESLQKESLQKESLQKEANTKTETKREGEQHD